MRTILALLIAALVALLPPARDNPPPKEWQPLIDATTSAIRKKDAAALDKLLISWVEADAACSVTNPANAKQAIEMDQRRPKRIARALDDCNIMDWKTARFVSASGGEPAPSKCDRFKPIKPVSLLYDDDPLAWTITLEPVMLNGKRLLLSPPNCLSSVKK